MGNRLKPAPPVDLRVAPPDSDENLTINQLLGNRSDVHQTHTIYSHLTDLWHAKHLPQLVWPSLSDAILVTAHADAWKLGNFSELIAANDIVVEFHIHHVQIVEPSANGEYELVFYMGMMEVFRVSFSRTDKKDDVEGLDIRSAHCEASEQIQMKLASGNAASADSLRVKVWYHEHPHVHPHL